MTASIPPGASTGVDVTKPSAARVYDYLLGGSTNWAIDREFADGLVRQSPLVKPLAVANRRWLGRVVAAALDAGVTQFLDLGAGLPTVGAVHEIVARHTGQGRVVYVDNEPIVHSHLSVTLDKGEGLCAWVAAVREDLRNPTAVIEAPETQELIDFNQPLCVLMAAILHFVGGDTDVPSLIRRYRDAVAPGSWLAISHVAHDAAPDTPQAAQIADLVASYQDTQTPAHLRDRTEIDSWFTAWGKLVDPGLVHLPDWRPETPHLDPTTAGVRPFSWCGVGVTPDGSW